jgi:hypothetical protein
MKNITSLITAFLVIASFLMGCDKNDGPVPVDLYRVPQVQVLKVDGTDAVIDVLNLANFKGVFTVGTYFQTDALPTKMDVVIVKNGKNAEARVFKADVTTFPSQFEISAADLAALFGEEIALNDRFDVGGDVYTSAGKFQAFPTTGVANGGGVASQPGASPFIRYSAVCAYDPEIYQGDFVVVEDEFEDLAPGDIVTLTKVSETSFSYIYPSAVNPIPIVVTVNPATNATSITKQKIGSAFTWNPAYTNPNVASTPNVDNVVLPCDQSFSVYISYTVDQGGFGNYWLKMKKK